MLFLFFVFFTVSSFFHTGSTNLFLGGHDSSACTALAIQDKFRIYCRSFETVLHLIKMESLTVEGL